MKFLCDQCKAKYQIADEKVAGRTVRMKCRKCGHMIEVRAEVTESSVARHAPRPDEPRSSGGLATSLSAARPARSSVAPGALAGAFQRRIQDDDDEKTMMGPVPSSFDASVTEEWYAAINGLPVGPMRLSELRGKAAAGAINDDTLVWQEGFEEWRPVKTITSLAAIVREAAPAKPLTGQSSPPGPVAPSPPRAAVTRPSAAARQTAPLGPAPAALRNNVVPISRGGGGGGGAAAVALAPSHHAPAHHAQPHPTSHPAPHPASVSAVPAAAAAPASNPFAGVDPFAAPIAPADPFAFPPAAPDVDPFAVPAPISAVAPQLTPAPSPAYAPAALEVAAPPTASVPPPPAQRSMAPLIFVAAVVLAGAFGVTAAVMTFKSDPAAKTVPSAATGAPTEAPIVSAAPTETVAAPAPSASASQKVASNWRPPTAAAAPSASAKPSGGAVDLGSLGLNTGGTTPTAKTEIPRPAGEGPSGRALDTASVQRTINTYKAAVKKRCWDNASESAPSANVSVSISVGGNGQVTSASGSGNPPTVAKCVENHVRGWHFEGTGNVVIPFHFVRQ